MHTEVIFIAELFEVRYAEILSHQQILNHLYIRYIDLQ